MSDDKVVIAHGRTFIDVECAWQQGGLAVTRHVGWGHEDAPPDTWTVTHLPTGYQIQRKALPLLAARRLAEQVLPLVDWSVMTAPLIVKAIREKAPWTLAVTQAVRVAQDGPTDAESGAN